MMKRYSLFVTLIVFLLGLMTGCGVETGNPDQVPPDDNYDEDVELFMIQYSQLNTEVIPGSEENTSSTLSLMESYNFDDNMKHYDLSLSTTCEVDAQGNVGSMQMDWDRKFEFYLEGNLNKRKVSGSKKVTSFLQVSDMQGEGRCYKDILLVPYLSMSKGQMQYTFSRERLYQEALVDSGANIRQVNLTATGGKSVSWVRNDDNAEDYYSDSASISFSISSETKLEKRTGSLEITAGIETAEPLVLDRRFELVEGPLGHKRRGRWEKFNLISGKTKATRKDGKVIESIYEDVVFEKENDCQFVSGIIKFNLYESEDAEEAIRTVKVVKNDENMVFEFPNGITLTRDMAECKTY
ncbi:MAG: hypothetical protein R3B45_05035 [Bdellovibrionota bacterium]